MINWQERIVSNQKVLGGRPTFRGTRVSVEFVLSLLAVGWDERSLELHFPALRPSDVQCAIAFATEITRRNMDDVLRSLKRVNEDPEFSALHQDLTEPEDVDETKVLCQVMKIPERD